jgi:hypothetical protein
MENYNDNTIDNASERDATSLKATQPTAIVGNSDPYIAKGFKPNDPRRVGLKNKSAFAKKCRRLGLTRNQMRQMQSRSNAALLLRQGIEPNPGPYNKNNNNKKQWKQSVNKANKRNNAIAKSAADNQSKEEAKTDVKVEILAEVKAAQLEGVPVPDDVKSRADNVKVCYNCGKPGHVKKDCRSIQPVPSNIVINAAPPPSSPPSEKPKPMMPEKMEPPKSSCDSLRKGRKIYTSYPVFSSLLSPFLFFSVIIFICAISYEVKVYRLAENRYQFKSSYRVLSRVGKNCFENPSLCFDTWSYDEIYDRPYYMPTWFTIYWDNYTFFDDSRIVQGHFQINFTQIGEQFEWLYDYHWNAGPFHPLVIFNNVAHLLGFEGANSLLTINYPYVEWNHGMCDVNPTKCIVGIARSIRNPVWVEFWRGVPVYVEHFNWTLLNILVSRSIIYGALIAFWFLAFMFPVTYQRFITVGKPHKTTDQDFRADTESLVKLRHQFEFISTVKSGWKITMSRRWFDYNTLQYEPDAVIVAYRTQAKYVADYEMLTQLLTHSTAPLSPEFDVVYAKMEQTAKTLHTANYDRTRITDGNLVRQDTVQCAFQIYKHLKSRRMLADFQHS